LRGELKGGVLKKEFFMRSGYKPAVSQHTRDFAKKLRSNPTDAKRKLWAYLRSKRIGEKFQRQEPIGEYICDFYCKEARLIVEIDGGRHFGEDGKERDARRSKALESLGLKVIRFSNYDVLMNIEAVMDVICDYIVKRIS